MMPLNIRHVYSGVANHVQTKYFFNDKWFPMDLSNSLP